MPTTYGPVVDVQFFKAEPTTIYVYYDYAPSGRPDVVGTRGDLALLMGEYMRRRCPIGIVLDRLEEYPEETDATLEDVQAMVAFLRTRYPNGV